MVLNPVTMTIGPEEAQAMLDNLMPHYRPLNENQVERMAEAMRQGAFCTKEPLHEDEELGLVNGRRRLVALIRGKFEFLRS